jgi:hypothetical protein
MPERRQQNSQAGFKVQLGKGNGRKPLKSNCLRNQRHKFVRNAELHSAVSPNCIRQDAEKTMRKFFEPLRIENPRYGRLKICATITVLPPPN